MKNAMMQIVKLFSVMVLFCGAAMAADEIHAFDNPEQKRIYLELGDELRCPKCQNQSIAGSNAGVAKDLKNKVYKLVKEGNSKQQVIDFMVERYGYFVTYKPPITAGTIILWVFPIVFLLFTLILIWVKSKRSQLAVDKSQWTDEQEQQLNALIEAIEQPTEQMTEQSTKQPEGA